MDTRQFVTTHLHHGVQINFLEFHVENLECNVELSRNQNKNVVVPAAAEWWHCAALCGASPGLTGHWAADTHAARASTAALAIPALKYFLHECKYFSPDMITLPRWILFTYNNPIIICSNMEKYFISVTIFSWLATGVWKYPQSSSAGRLSHFTSQQADKTPPDLCRDIGLYVSLIWLWGPKYAPAPAPATRTLTTEILTRGDLVQLFLVICKWLGDATR